MDFRIIINSEPLQLPPDVQVTIQRISPLFSDQGSQTLPLTVPYTPHNARLLRYGHRIDNAVRPAQGEPCTIVTGPLHMNGIVKLLAASKGTGFELSIGLDNAEAYNTWRQKKLNLCSSALITDDTTGITTEDREICVWKKPDDDTDEDTTDQFVTTRLVYAWKALEIAVSDLGYTIADGCNPLYDDTNLRRVVLLNNIADKDGTMADMLPDCTVADFMQALYARFGLIAEADTGERTIHLALIKDIIARKPQDTDMPMAAPLLMRYAQPQYVKLSAQTSFDGAATPVEALQDFMDTYGSAEPKFLADTGRLHVLSDKYGEKDVSPHFAFDPKPQGAQQLDISSPDECCDTMLVWSQRDVCMEQARHVPLYLCGMRYRHAQEPADLFHQDKEVPQWIGTTTPLSFAVYSTRGLCVASGNMWLTWNFSRGLYNTYWRTYDDLLRRALAAVEMQCAVSPAFELPMLQPFKVQGTPLMPESLECDMPFHAFGTAIVKARTLTPADTGVKAATATTQASPSTIWSYRQGLSGAPDFDQWILDYHFYEPQGAASPVERSVEAEMKAAFANYIFKGEYETFSLERVHYNILTTADDYDAAARRFIRRQALLSTRFYNTGAERTAMFSMPVRLEVWYDTVKGERLQHNMWFTYSVQCTFRVQGV